MGNPRRITVALFNLWKFLMMQTIEGDINFCSKLEAELHNKREFSGRNTLLSNTYFVKYGRGDVSSKLLHLIFVQIESHT